MAQGGMSVPAYAYAANNPLRYTDPDGRELVMSWVTKIFYPAAKVAALQSAIDALNKPSKECACGLSGGGAYDGAPWKDRDVLVEISPFVFGQNARASSSGPARIISLNSDLDPINYQGTIAHEGGHFRFPYIGIGAGHFFADPVSWLNETERFVMPETHCAAPGDSIRPWGYDDPFHCSCD
jgi:hypothetical protein